MKKFLSFVLVILFTCIMAFHASAIVPDPDSIQVKCINGVHYGQLVGVNCGMSGMSECIQTNFANCTSHVDCTTCTLNGATYVECMNCHHIFRTLSVRHGCGRLHTQYGNYIAIDSICPYGWAGPTSFVVIN